MAIENEDTANSEEDASVDNAKTEKIAEKLQAMGVMGSSKKSAEAGSNKMMALMMVLIVAVPASAIIAYIAMPQQLDDVLSLSNGVENKTLNNFQAAQQTPAYPSAESFNRTQEPEWLAQRRAEIEKRRAEFEKHNTDHYAANRSSSEPPQWVKDRQAQMEQRRAEFEKQNVDNYAVNRNPSEPPQWVKDQQALMQQEQEKYQQQWAKRSADMPYNRAPNQPGYMANPGMNAYQSYQAPVNAYAQNPGPYYNGYAQPINPYYYNNAPYSGPHRMPYGQYGYPYR